MIDYRKGCFATLGHGEFCTEGWLCENCTEIVRLIDENKRLREFLNGVGPMQAEIGKLREIEKEAMLMIDEINLYDDEVKRLRGMIMRMDAYYTAGGNIPYSLKLEVNKIFKEESDD